jgi:hypothetical protein
VWLLVRGSRFLVHFAMEQLHDGTEENTQMIYKAYERWAGEKYETNKLKMIYNDYQENVKTVHDICYDILELLDEKEESIQAQEELKEIRERIKANKNKNTHQQNTNW